MKRFLKIISLILSFTLIIGAASMGSIASAGPAAGQEYDLHGLNPDNATVKPTLTISSETLEYNDALSSRVRNVTLSVKGAADKYAPTGLHIQFDPRLKIITKTVGGKTIYAKLGDAGEYLSSDQQGDGDNGFFVATAASDDVGQDGVLWKFQVELPEEIDPAGDTFPIEIAYKSTPSAQDLFTNGDKDEQGQLMQAYVFTKGIYQGGITVKAVPGNTVSVSANPTNGGTVTGGGTYTPGSTATVTATPNTGYHFVNWTENSEVVSTNADYSFTVNNDRNLVANFELDTHSISVTANNADGGTVSGGGPYNYGGSATVTATPKDHYHFVNWTENDEEVSTDATYTFTVEKDRNLVANFAIDTFTIDFVNDDGTPLQSGSVAYGETPSYSGETPTKQSTPEYTYTFAAWSPSVVPVTTGATYTATYTPTPVDYKLTWVIDSENYKNETIPFGSNVSAPEVDERAGYTFEWVDEIPETMPAEDVTINGKFTAIKYTATFVNEDGTELETREYTVETTSIDEPAVPEKQGYEGKWEEYTLKIGGVTIKPVYTNISSITLNTDGISDTIGYKEDQTFKADAKDLPEGAEIHWFVNGEDVGTGSSYKVEDPTEDYTVQAKVIDSDGTVLAETETQKIHVKNGFFDRIKAFFTELIAQILGKAIADLLFSVC
ncbi:MAG: hypothetical protein IK085_03655 [Clostridia bacterium]|nr:hypothetical protein [Clostridia bacterium]